jgi:lipopolysaccharide/colanic/teichoic acid biosynthesis glycosyltransferase
MCWISDLPNARASQDRSGGVAKRLFDVSAATLGLLILSPVMLLAAVAIMLTDGFPILFHQKRVGRSGREFHIHKFRTMRLDRQTEGASFEPGTTRRVTAVGRWLRRTKVDELPQLWNVLAGEMSLVGPRPEVRQWVEAYPDRWASVLIVRPGMTDPASVLYRYEEDMLAASPDPERTYREEILPHKLDLYEAYVRERSFWGDVRLILQTLAALFAPQHRAGSNMIKQPKESHGNILCCL